MDIICTLRKLRGQVSGATVIALPEVGVLAVQLSRQDLGLRGCHATVQCDAALDELFVLLAGAGLTPAPSAPGFSALRLRISLTNNRGTLVKLLFDGLPSAQGKLYGTVNGKPVLAHAAFGRSVRAWVARQQAVIPASPLVHAALQERLPAD